jgi:hypothetical protein
MILTLLMMMKTQNNLKAKPSLEQIDSGCEKKPKVDSINRLGRVVVAPKEEI